MTRRSTLVLLAGLIVAGSPLTVRAQDTTTKQDTTTHVRTRHARAHSQVRIPVTKQTSAGEVAARVDTVQLPGRVDTVTVTNNITKTDTLTVTRVDTLIQPLKLHELGAFYVGVDGGTSLPAPNFSDPSKPGWRIDGLLGVDPHGSPLGLRVSGGYAPYTTHDWVSFLPSAKMMNLDADLKLRVVSFSPPNMTIKVYGIGGASFSRFKNVLEFNSNTGQYFIGNNGGTTAVPSSDEAWHNGAGWNAGGGVEFQTGPTSFFVESRFARIKGMASYISNVPLLVGVTFR